MFNSWSMDQQVWSMTHCSLVLKLYMLLFTPTLQTHCNYQHGFSLTPNRSHRPLTVNLEPLWVVFIKVSHIRCDPHQLLFWRSQPRRQQIHAGVAPLLLRVYLTPYDAFFKHTFSPPYSSATTKYHSLPQHASNIQKPSCLFRMLYVGVLCMRVALTSRMHRLTLRTIPLIMIPTSPRLLASCLRLCVSVWLCACLMVQASL